MDQSRNERIENKIDNIVGDIGEIKTTLAKQHESLKYHIKRTDLLEKRVEPLWVMFKVSGVMVAGLAVAAAVAEILGYLNHVK